MFSPASFPFSEKLNQKNAEKPGNDVEAKKKKKNRCCLSN